MLGPNDDSLIISRVDSHPYAYTDVQVLGVPSWKVLQRLGRVACTYDGQESHGGSPPGFG